MSKVYNLLALSSNPNWFVSLYLNTYWASVTFVTKQVLLISISKLVQADGQAGSGEKKN